MSVPEAAAQLQASEAYVRRLVSRRRINAVKVGPVWAIYESDLQAFSRLRRPPGRPPMVVAAPSGELEMRVRIEGERVTAGTGPLLRKPRRKRQKR